MANDLSFEALRRMGNKNHNVEVDGGVEEGKRKGWFSPVIIWDQRVEEKEDFKGLDLLQDWEPGD